MSSVCVLALGNLMRHCVGSVLQVSSIRAKPRSTQKSLRKTWCDRCPSSSEHGTLSTQFELLPCMLRFWLGAAWAGSIHFYQHNYGRYITTDQDYVGKAWGALIVAKTKNRLQCCPSSYDHDVSTVICWVTPLCLTTPYSLAYLCHHTTCTETITIIMILLSLLFGAGCSITCLFMI